MTEPLNQPTTTSTPQPESFSWGNLWSDSPAAYKGGVVVAVIAWFVGVSSSTVTSINGVVSCNYFDLVKVGGAALVLCLAVAGFLANARKPRHALPTWLSATIAAVLVAVAALLAIRGLGIAMSPCQNLTID